MDILNGYKTYIGILIAISPAIAKMFGKDLGDLTGLENTLITIVGGIIALISRFMAKPAA